MKRSYLPFTLVLCFLVLMARSQKLAEPILLWPDGAPGATGTSDEDKPAVIPFLPDVAKRNGAAVLVVPGGGFTIRAVDHEGVLVAQWLRDQGIAAFLLRYRLRPLYDRNDWTRDGKRAMQWIRAHAQEYHLSTNRVGAVGFSAGANLIPDITLRATKGQPGSQDLLEQFSSRPDFIILAYGSMAITDFTDADIQEEFPPTFLYGTVEDHGSQTGMASMYTKLYQAGVPVEAHFFQNGIHGTGFAIGDPVLGQWKFLLKNWMSINGFLSSKPQISLDGVVTLDGSPLLKGMVILTPLEDAGAPPVTIYVNNTGTGELGRFHVPQEQGPVEGRYRVEVRQDATRWVSNSREPFMIDMMAKQRNGTLTEADRKAWGAYLRKRDLSPSIDNQRVFVRQHPGDQHDYTITVSAGQEIRLNVFSQ